MTKTEVPCRLDWKSLLCTDTITPNEKYPSSWLNYPIDCFEHDYKKIITSRTFRALQDKTQVYPLNRGDFVRTRLTHSIEVSTIGRQLCEMLFTSLKNSVIDDFKAHMEDYMGKIPTILASAGLLHDMGNPPFGHEGETAIKSWFKEHLASDAFACRGKPVRDWLNEQMRADLCSFDGNAQIIRILGKCRFPTEDTEANVSYATISALIKYPVNSLGIDPASPDARVHKIGYYLSEEAIVAEIRRKTGICIDEQPHARNPMTYLLEAADDIAYTCSDIEDAFTKGDFDIRFLISFFENELASVPQDQSETDEIGIMCTENILNRLRQCLSRQEDLYRQNVLFQDWVGYLRNWLIYAAANGFVENYEDIMNGCFTGEILGDGLYKYTVQILKKLMRQHVFPQNRMNTIQAFRIMDQLLDRFIPAAVCWDSGEKPDLLNSSFIEQIPRKYRYAYELEKTGDENYNLYLRLRTVIDYISSLTDRRALEIYREINAI